MSRKRASERSSSAPSQHSKAAKAHTPAHAAYHGLAYPPYPCSINTSAQVLPGTLVWDNPSSYARSPFITSGPIRNMSMGTAGRPGMPSSARRMLAPYFAASTGFLAGPLTLPSPMLPALANSMSHLPRLPRWLFVFRGPRTIDRQFLPICNSNCKLPGPYTALINSRFVISEAEV